MRIRVRTRQLRKLLRFLVLGAILLLVMMVSAVTAMRFAIHGREVFVPKFVGVRQPEAERIAVDNGLTLSAEDRFFSATVPEGAVISQSPFNGVRVRRGTRVRVAVSLGPPKTEVPNLIGQSMRAAQINTQRRGLDIGEVSTITIPNAEEGQVIGQAPPPGAVATSPKVNTLVAAGESQQFFLMPDLSGKQLAEIEPQIKQAGFELKVVTAKSAETAATPPATTAKTGASKEPQRGSIVRQTPAAGHRIAAKGTIILEVEVR